jgi:hypothetical protein
VHQIYYRTIDSLDPRPPQEVIGELSVKIYSSSTSLTLMPATVNQNNTATLAGHAQLLTMEDDVASDQEDDDDEHDLDFAIDPSNDHINGVVDAIGYPE